MARIAVTMILHTMVAKRSRCQITCVYTFIKVAGAWKERETRLGGRGRGMMWGGLWWVKFLVIWRL